jgi:Ca2+-dependent lipid-binding protein
MFLGFNPRWNQEMSFSLKVPELAMVHFIVRDSSTTGKDAMLGMYALPFTSIQQGTAVSHCMNISFLDRVQLLNTAATP